MTPRVDQRNSNGNLLTNACLLVSTRSTNITISRDTDLLGQTKDANRVGQRPDVRADKGMADVVSHSPTGSDHHSIRNILRPTTERT